MSYSHDRVNQGNQSNNDLHKYYDCRPSTSQTKTGFPLGDEDPLLNDIVQTNQVVTSQTTMPVNDIVIQEYKVEDYIEKTLEVDNDTVENTCRQLHKMNEKLLIRRPIIYTVMQDKFLVTKNNFTEELFRNTLSLKATTIPLIKDSWVDRYITNEFSKNMNDPFVADLSSFVEDYEDFKDLINSPGTEAIPDKVKDKIKYSLENLFSRFIIRDKELYIREKKLFVYNLNETLFMELESTPIPLLLMNDKSFLSLLMKNDLKPDNEVQVIMYDKKKDFVWTI